MLSFTKILLIVEYSFLMMKPKTSRE